MGKPGQNTTRKRNPSIMALAKINFAAAKPLAPLPAGEYPGKTKKWEAKPTKAGDSTNIVAQFEVQYTDSETNEDKTRTITTNWNLKDTALWRIKRDLIALGADPDDFEGGEDDGTGEGEEGGVNLQDILNEIFTGAGTPCTITLEINSFEQNGETRYNNNIVKVEAR